MTPEPPEEITLPISKWRISLLMGLLLVLSAFIAVWFSSSLLIWLGIGMQVVALIVAVFALFVTFLTFCKYEKFGLKLDSEGFTRKGLFSQTVKWADLKGFKRWMGIFIFAVYTDVYLEAHPGHPPEFQISNVYEGQGQKVLDTLNEWHRRHTSALNP